jgi:argininosuccinate lyase
VATTGLTIAERRTSNSKPESLSDIAIFSIKDIKVKNNILADKKYDYLFTVDSLNEIVAGIPFRDAYKAVAEQLENGTFQSPKETKHTHEGSINNLCLAEIKEKMKSSFSVAFSPAYSNKNLV